MNEELDFEQVAKIKVIGVGGSGGVGFLVFGTVHALYYIV